MTELDIKQIIDNKNNGVELEKYIVKKHNGLYLIKYNKSKLNDANSQTLGLFRSVITDGEIILSFAPPKSINYNSFIVENNFEDSHITEFIDGTMINVFYNKSNVDENGQNEPIWEIATRSNIGANCRFNLNSKKTFREMFYEACSPDVHTNFFNKLNKKYSYSFVLQHPENRIVHKILTPQLYLTNIYEINKTTVNEISVWDNKELYFISDHIKIPQTINMLYPSVNNWEYINLLCSGQQTSFELHGFIIKNNRNERTKLRNIEYEKIKRMRGNSPKLQYQFLELYKTNKVNNYLNYFPEHRELFSQFQKDFYKWTEKLYHYYIDCFIEKKIYLRNCQFEFKPILYHLQKHYLNDLKPNNNKVNFTYLKQYVKGIPTEKIMFSINYKNRIANNVNKIDDTGNLMTEN